MHPSEQACKYLPKEEKKEKVFSSVYATESFT